MKTTKQSWDELVEKNNTTAWREKRMGFKEGAQFVIDHLSEHPRVAAPLEALRHISDELDNRQCCQKGAYVSRELAVHYHNISKEALAEFERQR